MLIVKKFFLFILILILFSSAGAAENAYSVSEINEVNIDGVDYKVPILLYHNLEDDYDEVMRAIHLSPIEFKEQMLYLYEAGYNTITFEEYYNYVEHDKPLPNNPIIITFDDGYKSNYEYAYPVLKELNMKATIFIGTAYVGIVEKTAYPHFTWEEAKEMQNSGVIDIQSHSHLHRDMTKIQSIQVYAELVVSKYLIEEKLGKPCTVFAYPYGLYNTSLQNSALSLGYKIQVGVGDVGVNKREDGLRQLKRLTVFGGMTGEDVAEMIENNK